MKVSKIYHAVESYITEVFYYKIEKRDYQSIYSSGSQSGPYGPPGVLVNAKGVRVKLKLIWGSVNNVGWSVAGFCSQKFNMK